MKLRQTLSPPDAQNCAHVRSEAQTGSGPLSHSGRDDQGREPGQRFGNNASVIVNASNDLGGRPVIEFRDSAWVESLQVEDRSVDY